MECHLCTCGPGSSVNYEGTSLPSFPLPPSPPTPVPRPLQGAPYVVRFGETFLVPGGMNLPRRIECFGSDGRVYRQLVKVALALTQKRHFCLGDRGTSPRRICFPHIFLPLQAELKTSLEQERPSGGMEG